LQRLNSAKGTTVTIIRIGTTKKYSDGWAAAFGGKKKSGSNGSATKSAGKSSGKKRTPMASKTTASKTAAASKAHAGSTAVSKKMKGASKKKVKR
jgi:hypothetical protein